MEPAVVRHVHQAVDRPGGVGMVELVDNAADEMGNGIFEANQGGQIPILERKSFGSCPASMPKFPP